MRGFSQGRASFAGLVLLCVLIDTGDYANATGRSPIGGGPRLSPMGAQARKALSSTTSSSRRRRPASQAGQAAGVGAAASGSFFVASCVGRPMYFSGSSITFAKCLSASAQ